MTKARPEAVTVRASCVRCGHSRVDILRMVDALGALREGRPMVRCSRCGLPDVILSAPATVEPVPARQIHLFKN